MPEKLFELKLPGNLPLHTERASPPPLLTLTVRCVPRNGQRQAVTSVGTNAPDYGCASDRKSSRHEGTERLLIRLRRHCLALSGERAMTPLAAAGLVLVLSLPLHWLVVRHFDRVEDPDFLRHHGIVVLMESALDVRSEPIGEYLGHPIPGSVTFKGMLYRFDHVLDRRLRERIGSGELFLEPGLVYVAA
ncbi:MAG: hypothetical protein ACXWUK_04650 [Burkholderiales bacterium]